MDGFNENNIEWYLLDYWRCKCRYLVAGAMVENAKHSMASAGTQWDLALSAAIQHVLVVLSHCCSPNELTLHASLIYCGQNALKLLFRFSFRPFYEFSFAFESFLLNS